MIRPEDCAEIVRLLSGSARTRACPHVVVERVNSSGAGGDPPEPSGARR